ncbi:hypothetical protein SAMN04489729_7869 [Amycolatopsis lurida]|nr:hypothetical protein SAMN04489729_7869 [Amycolatopsis lurida]
MLSRTRGIQRTWAPTRTTRSGDTAGAGSATPFDGVRRRAPDLLQSLNSIEFAMPILKVRYSEKTALPRRTCQGGAVFHHCGAKGNRTPDPSLSGFARGADLRLTRTRWSAGAVALCLMRFGVVGRCCNRRRAPGLLQENWCESRTASDSRGSVRPWSRRGDAAVRKGSSSGVDSVRPALATTTAKSWCGRFGRVRRSFSGCLERLLVRRRPVVTPSRVGTVLEQERAELDLEVSVRGTSGQMEAERGQAEQGKDRH